MTLDGYQSGAFDHRFSGDQIILRLVEVPYQINRSPSTKKDNSMNFDKTLKASFSHSKINENNNALNLDQTGSRA